MIGKTLTKGANQVYITGFDKSNAAEVMNAKANANFVSFLPAEIPNRLFYRSDNYAFFETFNVPSHTISTFDFENYVHYHQLSDEVVQLDIDNMHAVINTSTFIIAQLLLDNVGIQAKQ